MDRRGWMTLRVLINRYNPKAGNALLKFLPKDQLAAVTSIDVRSTDLTPILQQAEKTISRIHYSWIQPLLSKFPNRLHPIVYAALTPEQASGLHATSSVPISNLVRKFILNHLSSLLKINDHFPIEYLPESEFSPLISWSKARLVNLIDFLGLYDLASEVRKIVNPNHLKNIYTCLTPKQFHFLKLCLNQKEQITSPKLGIDPSKQDCAKLKQIIHRRGLLRLGRALCGQNRDLVWHIAYTLDMGRGKILLKEYQEAPMPKITPILKQQVLNLMNFLKSE